MTHAEYSAALKRARLWAGVAHAVAAVLLMICLTGLWFLWFSEIQKMAVVFRDSTRSVADDGVYGAWMGLCWGFTIVVPSLVLPLWPVVVIHRKLGGMCPNCGALLTWGRRPIQIESSGVCRKCRFVVFDVGSSEEAGF
ncbi:MAG: hypothetical protein JSS02_27095 [Planctomycetes bacterium]|nr:hypothetical protein [Planctomycetota bacterium]